MTEPINLRPARKTKKRLDKQKSAANNRLQFGQSKLEKSKAKLAQTKLQTHLNAHKLEKGN
ncbi:MAG: DUF4169 family protein [Robiginitomaculum sp.]|nr:DUF4169 family protein [Robiginitomaculum sp.]